MIKYFILILAIITTFIACGSVEDKIDDSVKQSQNQMINEILEASKAFAIVHEAAIKNSSDTSIIDKINKFYTHTVKTAKFIDSLQTEMGKLEEKDPKSIDLIQRVFLTEGFGDSLFKKVRLSYYFAEELASEDSIKFLISSIHDTYSDEAKDQLFTQNSPMGVSMLLYGIESELLKDAVKSLESYNLNATSTKGNK